MKGKLKKLKRYLEHQKNFYGEWCAMTLYHMPNIFYLSHLANGEYASVSFEQQDVYDRHDNYHDVMGFYHTHPPGFKAQLSQVDIATMGAWQRCLGIPLWCGIDCGWEVRWYLFYKGESYVDARDMISPAVHTQIIEVTK